MAVLTPMTLDEIDARVKDILRRNMGLTTPTQPEETLADLGVDSLDVVDIALQLEDEFQLMFVDDFVPELNSTTRTIAEEIQRRLSA